MDAETADCLTRIARVAFHASIETFLVGGMVRDIVSGLKPISTSPDLTILGEASLFARRLAAEIENSALVSVSQHHTAEVMIGNTSVDIASARIDSYDPPGSLPQITLVDNIETDLSRRDYSVNAMALPISQGGFGALIDPFNGRSDAHNGVLRVIREGSFDEDPLRMLRGVRLAARYRFKFEPNTRAEISASLNHLETMIMRSPQRVFNEFRLWFHPRENLADLVSIANETRLLEALGIFDVDDLAVLCNLRARAPELERFAAFAYRLDADTAETLADRLQMPSDWRSAIRQLHTAKQVADRCAVGQVTDLSLRKSLTEVRDEILQAIIATETDANIVDRFNAFRRQIQHVKPDLNGDDLIDLGVPRGPRIGELLNELLELRIERSISNAQEEREHVIRRLSDG